jgi:hypothetical protein
VVEICRRNDKKNKQRLARMARRLQCCPNDPNDFQPHPGSNRMLREDAHGQWGMKRMKRHIVADGSIRRRGRKVGPRVKNGVLG